MLTRKKFEEKLQKQNMKLIITVVKLHTGALETLINSSELESKKEYLLNAYDNELKLKTFREIELIDIIVQLLA